MEANIELEIEKYLTHLRTCNRMQDWTEAQEALSLCPDGADKEMAYEEMRTKMKTCTCGMLNAYKKLQQALVSGCVCENQEADITEDGKHWMCKHCKKIIW